LSPKRKRRCASHREANQNLGESGQVKESQGAVVLSPRRDSEVLGRDPNQGERVVLGVR